MKTINMKQKNVITCDCGCAIEYEHSDFVLRQTDDSGDFLAVCVVCPECGCMHIRKPAELVEGDALLDTFKGAKPALADSLENYSFKEIKGLAKEGKVRSGMCKTIVLKDGSTAVLEVLGVEHDYLPGGGKASVTFGFRDLFGTDDNGGRDMNIECTNKGGWEKSEMRAYLNGDFFCLLPDDLTTEIVPVVKHTATSGKGKVESVTDKVFLPSEVEVFGAPKYSKEGEGEQYALFKDWKNRVKGYADGGYGRWWWLRSPYSGYSYYFCIVNANGNYNYNHAYNTYGVSPCFAI